MTMIQKGKWSHSGPVLLCIAATVWAGQAGDAGPGREWGERAGAYRLSISSDKTQYKAGEPIFIDTILKNVTEKSARMAMTSPETLYRMDVYIPYPSWMPIKPTAPLTELGIRLKFPRRADMHGWGVRASEEVIHKFELNQLHQMSAPGEYRVVFSCQLPQRVGGSAGWVTVTSNEIRVRVSEDK